MCADAPFEPGPEGRSLWELIYVKKKQLPLEDLYAVVKFDSLHDIERDRVNETASYDPLQANDIGLSQDPTSYDAAVTQIKSGAKRVLTTPYLREIKLALGSEDRFMSRLDMAIDSINPDKSKKSA